MTTAAPKNAHGANRSAAGKPAPISSDYHPDDLRMTIGEHLEELRTRLVLGLAGFFIACIVCFIFGDRVVWYFCKPLMNAMVANGFSPEVFTHEVGESFMVYVKISMITAASFASPWLIYQFWLFVAAGLYPKERKYITKYLPLSISLLVVGMVFLYVVVLPLMLRFFVAFSVGSPLQYPVSIDGNASNISVPVIPMLNGNPAHLQPGMEWFDKSEYRLKIALGTPEHPEVRVIPYGSTDMNTPQIALDTYIDMVVNLLLSFGLAFQMPLVVLTLVRIGIVSVQQLKGMRRYVYFIITVVAGFIVPDVVGGMIALMIPLMLLFELGLWLAREPGESTGLLTWFSRGWTRLKHEIKTRGLGGSIKTPLTWIGTLVMVALILHAMWRRNQAPEPATRPTTQPATQPVLRPTTEASTRPTTLSWAGPSTNPAPAASLPTTQPIN